LKTIAAKEANSLFDYTDKAAFVKALCDIPVCIIRKDEKNIFIS
jgi:hypothetical protein